MEFEISDELDQLPDNTNVVPADQVAFRSTPPASACEVRERQDCALHIPEEED